MQTLSELRKDTLALVKMALAEDIGKGDMTSLACLEPYPIKAHLVAKSEGVLSGVEPFTLAFEIVDSANTVTFKKTNGESFESGDVLAVIEGFNQTVLATERVALNFICHLSGVASLTRKFVEKVQKGGYAGKIVDTRKTIPGMRRLQKAAVVHGGGVNHRLGLYDMMLIKDNHIAAAGSITKAVEIMREYLKSPEFLLQFDLKEEEVQIEVEVTNEEQIKEAVSYGLKRILIDNQNIESLKNLVQIAKALNQEIKLEASGGVTLENVAQIAATGVDFISIGALTHSATAVDFSLEIVE
jgi:nicotinate-nucleotide pyrophosphorylase (carboxylating)